MIFWGRSIGSTLHEPTRNLVASRGVLTVVRTAVALLPLALLPTAAGAGGLPVLPARAAMQVERAAHTATLLADGRVLVTGGIRAGEAALASAELYDPESGTFSSTGEMASVRSGHTATLLRDGRVLIAGGWDDEDPLRTAELYDPATRRFTRTGPLTAGRGGATATLLRDGRVLVVGGYEGDHSLTSADLYDPVTGRFTRTGAMHAARAAHTATRLHDGSVLVTGGNTPDRVLRSAEIFDPRTGSFSVTGSLTVRRHKHAAALLSDGRVLVLGGPDERDWDGRYRTAEVFDPRSGRFSPTGLQSSSRFKLPDAVAVMPSGAVLVAGGASVVDRFRRGRFVRVARLDAARY